MNKTVHKIRPIEIAAWIASIVFFFVFLARLFSLSKVQTAYGSPIMSFPFVFGLFIGCAFIPSVLWLIASFTNKRSKAVATKSVDNIIYSENISSIKEKISSLKELGLLTEEEYNLKIKTIDDELDRERNDKLEQERKNKIITLLNELKNEGVLSKNEYEQKMNEINNEENSISGLVYECLHCGHESNKDFEYCPKCLKDDEGLTRKQK